MSTLGRWAAQDGTTAEVVHAATVILLRDGDHGPETLMLRRNSKIAFGGMWVFPGGRIDPGDVDPARPGDELATARNAAAREALEETQLRVEPGALVAFSHWTPPPEAARRYLTWFFVGAAPTDEVRVDGGEIHEHAWWSPTVALERQASGEVELAPPTWITLARLEGAADVAGVLAAAAAREPERFATHIAMDGDRAAALWAGDAGYDDRDLDRPGPRHRLWIAPGAWRYEAG